MRTAWRVIVVALSLVASRGYAQPPAGSDRLSAAAVVESLAVLKALNESVRRQYKNAPAWFRQGTIAWALYERCRHTPTVKQLDCTRPRLLADTSFMIAEELEPDNADYTLTRTQYLLASEGTYHREAPYLDRIMRSSVERMRRSPDPLAHANAAIDVGRLYWLRYDGAARRYWETTARSWVFEHLRRSTPDSIRRLGSYSWYTRDAMAKARGELDAKLRPDDGLFWGEWDYLRAVNYFREAYERAPTFIRAYRHYAIALADRNRWGELGAVARERLSKLPGDGWAWMTLGLAHYRLGEKPLAQEAFDSAERTLTTDDKRRIIRLERVLGSADLAAFARDPAGFEPMYWALADPLWGRNDDDPRLEFLARVAYAELMWTTDERDLHGVNSDRGAVHIRFGPPDRIYSMKKARNNNFGAIGWEYDFPGRGFVFERLAKYRTDRFADDTTIASGPPAAWGNLIVGRIDTIPTQFARFRASPDSVDVYVAMSPPIAELRRANEVRAPIRTDFWIKTQRLETVVHDSLFSDEPGVRTFQHRVGAGTYLYRGEAVAASARYAARATARFATQDGSPRGFALSGFGMSDVIVATRAVPRSGVATRWSDLTVDPLLTPARPRDNITLAWEVYGVSPTNGSAKYDVVVTIRPNRAQRPGTPSGSGIVARIGGVLGLNRRVIDDRVEYRYSRTVEHRDALLEMLTIDLGVTPPGVYRVSVTVIDDATGDSVSSTRILFIDN